MSLTASLPPAPEVVTLLEPAEVMSAICDPVRQALLALLADGKARSVNEVAAHLDRPPDGISKHLRILRNARLIRAVTPAGTDGRRQYHEMSPLFRSQDGTGRTVLDFGTVLLRLG